MLPIQYALEVRNGSAHIQGATATFELLLRSSVAFRSKKIPLGLRIYVCEGFTKMTIRNRLRTSGQTNNTPYQHIIRTRDNVYVHVNVSLRIAINNINSD